MADEGDNDEQDNLGDEQDDLYDEQDDSDDEQEHIPTAPWFTTEEINVSSGNCSNMYAGEWGIHQFCLFHVRRNFSSDFPDSHLKMLC